MSRLPGVTLSGRKSEGLSSGLFTPVYNMETTTNEELIAAVQKRPPLYDKTCDQYSNRIFLTKQWKEIGEEVGMDDASARKKWSGLRDYFLKVHKQQTTTKAGSAGGSTQRKWYLYDAMLFLLPYVTVRKTCSNLSVKSDDEVDGVSQMSSNFSLSSPGASTSEVNSSITTPDSMGISAEGDDSDVDASRPSRTNGDGLAHTSAQPNTADTAPTQPRKRRYKFPQERQQQNSLDSEILDAIKLISSKQTEKNEDEEELFLKSLAPKLRSLDPLSRLQCQAEMQMLLLKYMKQQVTNAPQDLYPLRSTISPSTPGQPKQVTDLGPNSPRNYPLQKQSGQATATDQNPYSPTRNYNNSNT